MLTKGFCRLIFVGDEIVRDEIVSPLKDISLFTRYLQNLSPNLILLWAMFNENGLS